MVEGIEMRGTALDVALKKTLSDMSDDQYTHRYMIYLSEKDDLIDMFDKFGNDGVPGDRTEFLQFVDKFLKQPVYDGKRVPTGNKEGQKDWWMMKFIEILTFKFE